MKEKQHATNMSSSDWVDLNQAERIYPFSRRTFWLWISEGRLAAYRPGRRKILLKRSDIDKLIEATRTGADLDVVVDKVLIELGGER
jgi:excisionase family DNA binding protein